MSPSREPKSIYWLGARAAVPAGSVDWKRIQADEAERLAAQLAVLSPLLRERTLAGLGIDAVRVHEGPPSALALQAARQALDDAQLGGASVKLVLDFSTLPGDYPGIWSLAHRVADGIGAADALCLGVHGAGCAGLLVALRTAQALVSSERNLSPALLVAADCVPRGGRCCLPVSVMGDAASAVVLGTECPPGAWRPRLLSVTTSAVAAHHAVIVAQGCPAVPEIDGALFEERVLPVHFLMLHRVLGRALTLAARSLTEVTDCVYPNTSLLDRSGVTRALGIDPARLSGPGPCELGHAFANDLILNFPELRPASDPPFCAALLAVGSGFTWGAGIVG